VWAALDRASEGIGVVIGLGLGPLVFAVAAIRRGRFVHPDGRIYRGHFEALHDAPLGRALAGPAIARISTTLNLARGADDEHADVLGLAVRFGAGTGAEVPSPLPGPGDQDLLAASFRGFRKAASARAETDVHDALANVYRVVAPTIAPGGGALELRWVGLPFASMAATRRARLAEAIAGGRADFVLEVSREGDAWEAIGRLRLSGEVDLDETRLALSPFRAGRGFRPTGFTTGIRRVVYPASCLGRRLTGPRSHGS
jgi:hypothetical protein